jgi:energy-coupling factor transporter ATP-binding protein EcfA2
LSLDDLGCPEIFREIADTPRGLVLVTGPTGSGKSTTLAAMVDYINDHKHDHILTIEDPIEFVHENKKCLLNQREVHRDTLSFEAALRSALREDPDVILVGEMRDLETIRLAMTAAETGLEGVVLHRHLMCLQLGALVLILIGLRGSMMTGEKPACAISVRVLERLVVTVIPREPSLMKIIGSVLTAMILICGTPNYLT